MSTYTDSRQINVSSNYATLNNGSLLSSVSFNFQGLLRDEEDILYKQISICNAEIPVSFYIINEYNDTLKYIVDSGEIQTLTFTHGNFNATTFTTEFKSLMNGWNCSVNKLTGKLTFIAFSEFQFLEDSSILYLLGFSNKTHYSNNGLLEGDFLCDFSGIRRLSIRSNIMRLLNRDSSTGNYTSDISVIAVNQPAYGIIKYQNISGFKNILSNNTLDMIDIEIYDDVQNLVDFNGVNWAITLQLDIIRILKYGKEIKDNSSMDNIANLLTQLLGNTLPNVESDTTEEPENEISSSTSQIESTGDNDLDLLMYSKGINL